ncbi:glycosyltransferase, partial [Patescibacteria group bacterium]|nr:glycosyltransferase [Patescibacteria group bacterium]
IILADAGSKDRTIEIAKKYGCKVVPGGLPAKGRNEGAKAARGDLFLFLDSDLVLPEGFLDVFLQEFKKKNLDIASTDLDFLTDKKIYKIAAFLCNIYYRCTQRILPHISQCILVKKEFHNRIGGFDEEIMREYEETSKRHKFLTAEFLDLTNAVGSLKNLIEDLTGRINNEFNTGLVKINDEFARYFKLMFGGGSAKLENESGVTINVNMPHKRIRDLAALSGGERALVSIALLFAIVSVSRPPFLILDEIDAALDEVNAAQFAKVLKDFAEKTQFILITHNRATMEIANVLYGVTMGDDGVSKLFSLKLEDAVV